MGRTMTIGFSRWRTAVLLLGVLVVALVLRLDGLAFGLPSLYDPDEPIFVITALKLLRDHTLNPQWFGHPGTTTIYALAVVEATNFLAGHLTGRFPDSAAFARAIYADPSVVLLPARMFVLACGLLCLALTFWMGKRLFGDRVGLLAAALLALDPLHIRYSQIVRTDMHATVFMLLVLLSAIGIVRDGRTRHYVLAGVWLGFACATKWPAGTAAAGALAAGFWRMAQFPLERAIPMRRLSLMLAVAVVALFVASPYLFLDYPQLLSDLHGEARPYHLGATGHGLVHNVAWYVATPLRTALGTAGLALAAIGIAVGVRRSSAFAVALLPILVLFLLMISAQALIWERWVVPLLPLLSIAVAITVDSAGRWGRARFGRPGAFVVGGMALLAAVVPTLITARGQMAERATDTHALASAWLRGHAVSGSTVSVEHLAFDLLSTDWQFRFPVGDQGCVDVRSNLSGQIHYSTIGKWRGRRPVVDLGTVDPAKLDSCRTDWAILVNYDRYLAEPEHFGQEIATYRRLIAGGTLEASFYPKPGKIGGPIVRVVKLAPTLGR